MRTKVFALLFLLVLCLSFAGCGITAGTQRNIGESSRYTPAEIDAAMDAATRHFRRYFDGCTLTEITYDEAFSDRSAAEWAQRYGDEYGIILLSSFEVGPVSEGSLTPGQTYTRWQWILTGNIPGVWTLRDWGYG